MEDIRQAKILELSGTHTDEHEKYEYLKKNSVPRRADGQCVVSIYMVGDKEFNIVSSERLLRGAKAIRERKKNVRTLSPTIYEVPPQKSAYPYHYHTENEETFYILKGSGILRTPEGEREVSEGELLFFPANENGAHKLTSPSLTEALVYLDFDTSNEIDVTYYPDSGKIGIWGKNVNRVYRLDDSTGYYEGE